MKPNPWEWTEEDLLELIKLEVQESLQLDYKRCDALQRTDAKKNEISKDVSSFANAGGGTIVYGMQETGHIPTAIDAGFDPNEITKEWLEQVINSRIQRRINGVRVNPVSLTRSSPGRVAYVVFVPQSHSAPHQAWDKRFYRRFNFESVPMEEYEIRDVSNRSTSPDLSLDFVFRPGDSETALAVESDALYQEVLLAAQVQNFSQAVATHAVFHLHFDERLDIDDPPAEMRRHDETSSLRMDGVDVSLRKFTILWDDKKGLPIFAGITAEIPTPPVKIRIPRDVELLALRYTVGAPGMTAKDGFVFISVRDNLARIIVPSVKEADEPSEGAA